LPRTGTNMGPGEQQSIRGFARPGPPAHPSPADHWTREQLQAHQARALQQLREYVYAYSPFYRRFHAGHTDHPLRELPVLTKAMDMEHFDQLVTDPAVTLAEVQAHLAALAGSERLHGRYWVAATSGTTGRRGIFLWDLDEWVTVLASYNRSLDWAGATVSLTRRCGWRWSAPPPPGTSRPRPPRPPQRLRRSPPRRR
jgi:phenylacetate-coenzyme A ligase PaaK-like adenylate-forming protein